MRSLLTLGLSYAVAPARFFSERVPCVFMSLSDHTWQSVGLTIAVLVVLVSCDTPTSDPSLNTEVNVSPPLIAAKTYAFIGGPDSENEPIIDTTADAAVGPRSVTKPIPEGIENKISVNQGFEETLLSRGDDLATQTVRAQETFSLEASNSSLSGPAENAAYEAGPKTFTLDGGETGFRAIAATERSNFQVHVRNNTGVTLEDVEIALTNNGEDVSEDFGDIDGSFDVTKTFPRLGSRGEGDTRSAPITRWADKTVMNKVDVTVRADAGGSGRLASDELTVCLGGPNCLDGGDNENGRLAVETLYFVPDSNDRLTTTGAVDVLNPGRIDSSLTGGDARITMLSPRFEVGGLQIRSPGDTPSPELTFESFNLNYLNDILLDAQGDPLEFDLLNALDSRSIGTCAPCDIQISENEITERVTFTDLRSTEKVQFEIAADVEDRENLIVSVGDAAATTQAGLPVADSIEVNWGLGTNNTKQVTIRDTIEADFSGLEDLTDPENSVRLESASFRLQYANTLPLGGDLKLVVLDENEADVKTLADPLSVEAAPKERGTGRSSGTVKNTEELEVGSDRAALRALAQGRKIQLRLDFTQTNNPNVNARIRADDTFRFDLKVNTDALVNTN